MQTSLTAWEQANLNPRAQHPLLFPSYFFLFFFSMVFAGHRFRISRYVVIWRISWVFSDLHCHYSIQDDGIEAGYHRFLELLFRLSDDLDAGFNVRVWHFVLSYQAQFRKGTPAFANRVPFPPPFHRFLFQRPFLIQCLCTRFSAAFPPLELHVLI